MAKFYLTFSAYFMVFGTILLRTGLAENPEENGREMEGDILGVAPSIFLPTTRAGILGDYYRWPKATIPYTVDSGYPADLRQMLQQAMQQISQRTCIKFTPRKGEADYIHIFSGGGCYTYVGRIGGRQPVSLQKGCKRIGTFIHELMHAIGFFHEQSRTDRDQYVTINYNNIRSGEESQFRKYDVKKISNFGVAYDYDSLMHYSKTAFSKNGKDTITPKKSGAIIGRRDRMSGGDAAKINNMYCKKGRSWDDGAGEVERKLQLL